MKPPRVSSSLVLLALLVIAGGVGLSRRAHAQRNQEPAFEVTSVKANTSGAPNIGGPGDRFSSGRFQTTNIPLRVLMRQAFQRFQDDEMVGGPSWVDGDRWDIAGTTESPSAPMLPMIRTLLRDRFKLATHHETRELSVYALVFARADHQLGPSMRSTTEPPNFRQGVGSLAGRASIGVLLSTLSGLTRRIVIDRTGLAGTYELALHWMPATLPAGVTPDVPDSPSVFTAVQEQLGLKLESTRAPIDVLVIDHVEKPTED
jgi:uncharacterized protein (TIGR03435 family)